MSVLIYKIHRGKQELKLARFKMMGGPIPFYTLTVEPVQEGATVSLSGKGGEQVGNSIKVEMGTVVTYTVSKDGYDTITKTHKVMSDITLTPSLVLVDKFKFTVNSGDDSSFILPLSSVYGNATEWNLSIDWGDGISETSTGTADTLTGTGLSHTYSEANKDYQITLSGDVGFLKQFGFYNNVIGCNVNTNKEKMKSLDTPLLSKMFSSSIDSTTHNLFTHMFSGCTSLTIGSEFNLPQDLTIVGNNFAYYMFYNCKNLESNQVFNLPQNITSVGTEFASNMFVGCAKFNMNSIFQIPQNITSFGISFCREMFYGLKNLTLNGVFQIPQNITTVSPKFFQGTFYNNASITDGVKQFFGNLILNQTELDKSEVFKQTFYGCSNISETLTAETVPMLTVVPTNSNHCFENASEAANKSSPINWGGLGITDPELYAWTAEQQGKTLSAYTRTTDVTYYAWDNNDDSFTPQIVYTLSETPVENDNCYNADGEIIGYTNYVYLYGAQPFIYFTAKTRVADLGSWVRTSSEDITKSVTEIVYTLDNPPTTNSSVYYEDGSINLSNTIVGVADDNSYIEINSSDTTGTWNRYELGDINLGSTISSTMYTETEDITDASKIYYSDGTEYNPYQMVTLTIVPSLEDASVILSATGFTQSGNSIRVDTGTSVSYTVSKEGYKTKSSTITVNADTTLNISMEIDDGVALYAYEAEGQAPVYTDTQIITNDTKLYNADGSEYQHFNGIKLSAYGLDSDNVIYTNEDTTMLYNADGSLYKPFTTN